MARGRSLGTKATGRPFAKVRFIPCWACRLAGTVLAMRHRHIREGDEHCVEAVEDVLDRGTVEDWRRLAREVLTHPGGEAAHSLRVVLGYARIYGTTPLWQDFLADVDRANEEGDTGTPPPAAGWGKAWDADG